jgi:hypothetical protein
LFLLTAAVLAQDTDLEFTIDASGPTVPLPKIFQPNIDLSGRGFHRDASWPQSLAAKEAIDIWAKDIGFPGLYRLQYNLWEINQLAREKEQQDKLLANYETVIKTISDSGGTVILNLFGTPAGLGKVLDKKSPPWDMAAFKELAKSLMRELSCKKKYNVWYEVWNAPDLDEFFLGRKQDYLTLYRAVAESAEELEDEAGIHIPVGGPSVSWWFQSTEGNTILTPERSLIYELIRYCYHYQLPLDFISWHSYSSDPSPYKEKTVYKNKAAVNLIRDWLTYFRFKRDTPLVIDEWVFDLDANVLAERGEKSFVAASFIPSRLKNMNSSGIDNQVYFCLEDFQANKEGVERNVGVFSFEPEHPSYKGAPKAAYNAFRMLRNLGKDMYTLKNDDPFCGILATKTADGFALLLYNYIDPQSALNYLSNNIAVLGGAERKILLNVVKSDKLNKLLRYQLEASSLRLPKKVKALVAKAQELNSRAQERLSSPRKVKLTLKNLKENYLYSRYSVDSSCALNCEFSPAQEKEIAAAELVQEPLDLAPYSLQMIILKKKPEEPAPDPVVSPAQPAAESAAAPAAEQKATEEKKE